MLDVHGRRLPHGSQQAFCAEHSLSRPTLARMLRTGAVILNPEATKLVAMPTPPPRGTAASAYPETTFKQRPTAEPLPPTWEGKCSAFQTLAERLIEDRPEGKSPEDAAGDLNCQVRLALGAALRRSVS